MQRYAITSLLSILLITMMGFQPALSQAADPVTPLTTIHLSTNTDTRYVVYEAFLRPVT